MKIFGYELIFRKHVPPVKEKEEVQHVHDVMPGFPNVKEYPKEKYWVYWECFIHDTPTGFTSTVRLNNRDPETVNPVMEEKSFSAETQLILYREMASWIRGKMDKYRKGA
jgi:hypothetical protein